MQLIKDEVVVKEFEYATVNRGNNQLKCSVTVTNKRVYTTDVSKRQVAHTEVPLDKVKSINSTFIVPKNRTSIYFIIYAIVFAVLGTGCFFSNVFEEVYEFLIVLGIAALCAVIAILLWQHPSFNLDFTTKGQEGKPLYTSVSKLIPSKGRSGKFNIHLNRHVCEDFMYSIGAALTEARIIAEQDKQKTEE